VRSRPRAGACRPRPRPGCRLVTSCRPPMPASRCPSRGRPRTRRMRTHPHSHPRCHPPHTRSRSRRGR
jgi:hypothetical protein